MAAPKPPFVANALWVCGPQLIADPEGMPLERELIQIGHQVYPTGVNKLFAARWCSKTIIVQARVRVCAKSAR
jgi:hypothetical protein